MIQIKDIDFRYPGSKHLVFRDFSLELKENNIYGLLGKNGTGKSTLLYLISGLLRQQQGTILVDGISAQDRKAEMLKDIFMVPEEFELPNVSLATYVKMNQGPATTAPEQAPMLWIMTFSPSALLRLVAVLTPTAMMAIGMAASNT